MYSLFAVLVCCLFASLFVCFLLYLFFRLFVRSFVCLIVLISFLVELVYFTGLVGQFFGRWLMDCIWNVFDFLFLIRFFFQLLTKELNSKESVLKQKDGKIEEMDKKIKAMVMKKIDDDDNQMLSTMRTVIRVTFSWC